MPNVIIPPGWRLPEKLATPESVYRSRRAFLKQLGFTGAGALLGSIAASQHLLAQDKPGAKKTYPFPRNPKFNDPKLRVTDEEFATGYNNFYEFTTSKTRVKRLTHRFVISPWEVEVAGLVEKPAKFSVDDLVSTMPMEERLYRFRCVEAWSMNVPWTGFPLSKLIEKVSPKSDAKFIKFTTFFPSRNLWRLLLNLTGPSSHVHKCLHNGGP